MEITDEAIGRLVRFILNNIEGATDGYKELAEAESRGEDNPYELACFRFNIASAAASVADKVADAIKRGAEDRYAKAQAKLRERETKPGIPLPEYRSDVWAAREPDAILRGRTYVQEHMEHG